MKTPTIWESASRPLFVRSVWLESPHQRRGVQHRHFILDYEAQRLAQQRRQPLRSAALTPGRSLKRKETFSNSTSFDLREDSVSYQSQASTENLLLIGSAKIKLQQPTTQQARQQFKLLKLVRRPSITRQPTHEYALSRRVRDLQELYSRHSSLQDLQSNLSMANLNPEERLAERVLNWLDLAGKSGLVKGIEDELPLDIAYTENHQPNYSIRNQQINEQQQNNYSRKLQRSVSSRYYNQHQHQQTKITSAVANQQQNNIRRHSRDAVKPITIIFNRDGFPVRLNRPARNIDLCTLASSASTTRRLAGNLASTRLYHGNQMVAYKARTVKPSTTTTTTIFRRQQTDTIQRTNSTRMRSSRDIEKSLAQSAQKRSHDDFITGNHGLDSKRQLHIFMPSLPKKGAISTSPSVLSAGGVEESSISLLSQKFNDTCKL